MNNSTCWAVKMYHKQKLQSLIKEIDLIVKLSPSSISASCKGSAKVCKAIREFREAIEPNVNQSDRLNQLHAAVDQAACQVTQSLVNLRKDRRLRGDWTRFAKRDIIRLKDELFALREFLLVNVNSFKPNSVSIGMHSLDLERLLEVLQKERAISERTFVMLTVHLAQNGRSKPKDQKIIEQISRISVNLSELHEIREASDNAWQGK
jgi:hypothetical protein